MTRRRVRAAAEAQRPGAAGLPWVLVTLAAGMVAGIVARPGAWHSALAVPPWMPAGWVFSPVSIALYLLMGIAALLVSRERGRPGVRVALTLHVAQLACNVLWSFLFFGMRQLDTAMLDLSVLWVLVALTARAFHALRPLAGWLLAPYLAWVTFGAALNLSVWLRN